MRENSARLLDKLFPEPGSYVRDERRNRIGRSVPLLRKRLRRAVRVLADPFKGQFKGQFKVEIESRRMYDNSGLFYLQWTSTPETTEGSVSFHAHCDDPRIRLAERGLRRRIR